MTPESLKTNDNNDKTGIKLNPEQEKNFKKFLEEKGYKEPINTSDPETQKKLSDLKNEFLEKQNNNFINSSSELLSWTALEKNFWNPENYKKFTNLMDKWVYSYFFAENWIFKDIKISESEKKAFSSSSAVYLLDSFYEEVEKNWNFEEIKKEINTFLWEKWDLTKLWENLTSGTKISESISLLKDIFTWNIAKVFAKIYKAEKLEQISWALKNTNLKNNQIFSNPNETFNFFNSVFKGNLSENDLKNLIESKNSDKTIFANDLSKFKEIWNKMGKIVTPEIWNFLASASWIADIFINWKEKIKKTLVENESLMETLKVFASLPVIWSFIKAILWFFGINPEKIWDNPEKNLETTKKEIIKKWSFLEEYKINENFWKNEKWEIEENFTEKLKEISNTKNIKNFWKNLENLFKKWWNFENFTKNPELKKLPDFWEKNILKNEKWEIIYENLNYLIDLYKDFLWEKNNSPDLTIENFVKNKLNKNQDIENEVFWNSWNDNQNLKDNSNSLDKEENILEQENILTKKAKEAIEENRKEKTETAQDNLTSAVWASLVASTINKNKDYKKENEQNNQNTKTPEKKPEQKTDFLINKNEWFEFLNNKINFVFTENGKKYEASLYWNDKWYLTIIWNGEKVIFNWAKEFYSVLNDFKWKLDKKATWWDFWKTWVKASVELNWKTIREVLTNWLNEEVSAFWFSEKINKPWLKQILWENFIKWWILAKNNVSINFWDKNYSLNFEKSEWQKVA